MKKIIFCLLVICPLLIFELPVLAQRTVVSRGNYVRSISSQSSNSWFDRYEKTSVDQIGLAFGVSTMGVGLEAVTSLSYKFDIRAGITYMPPAIGLSRKLDVKDEELLERVGYNPLYDVSFKPNMFNGHVFLDYYPHETSTFHVTAGFYLGKSKIQAKGKLVNPDTGQKSVLKEGFDNWPNLVVDGQIMNIQGGRLDADIHMGIIVKPYVGIGFGRSIPGNSGMAVNCDVGILIQPTHSIYQDGNKSPDANNYKSEAIDISKYVNAVVVWPMARVQLAFRVR